MIDIEVFIRISKALAGIQKELRFMNDLKVMEAYQHGRIANKTLEDLSNKYRGGTK